jgi:hypothetical protein
MPIERMPCKTASPDRSSPTVETKCTFPPVRKAASATLRPTPPNDCLTLPGVDVCKIEVAAVFAVVAVISSASPPITKSG